MTKRKESFARPEEDLIRLKNMLKEAEANGDHEMMALRANVIADLEILVGVYKGMES